MFDNVNWYYIFCLAVISCGTIPKGYDEGGFSASVTLPSFKKDFNLNAANWVGDATGLANRSANITSFGVLGASFGALLALVVNDRFGRLRSWQGFVLLWASGIFMQIFSSGIYGLELFARIWGGLGAGGLTVVSPVYLAEVAPARTRGMVVTLNMVALLSLLSLGFFINYGVNKSMAATREQYRIVQCISLIPVGIAFALSMFMSDTPRWLASKDRTEEAMAVLQRLRKTSSSSSSSKNAQAVANEYEEIQEQVRRREQVLAGATTWDVAKEVLSTPRYRERFMLGAFVQVMAQWTGGNGITYYIPQIFQYAGVGGANASLITSGAYGLVKLVFTLVFTWGLVDYFGRRRCFIAGMLLQLVGHIYMSIYMAIFYQGDNKSASDAAIASVFIYAVGWSIGLCNVQALYGTEIYPTRIRAFCYSCNMALHWFCQFAIVRVTPNMFVGLGLSGAFVFWACVTFVGLAIMLVWAPETKGVPMERMDELFDCPWYMRWRAKVDLTQGGVAAARKSVLPDEKEEEAMAPRVEHA
ncbi:hypothetical protein SCUCBS95973_001536 [Sporothrix curviconia]|uniref:Major facilitator superfamily (MFS) profile domain-containing protein n=1 Tax=Sporothrix curviconia TaxID=1260050 RepID=A0ABP0AZE1_9PEZI